MNKLNRRDFIAGAVASVALAGCGNQTVLPKVNPDLQPATEAQKSRKRQERSAVGIIKCPSYEESIFKTIKPYLSKLGLPDLKNKTVLLKPNMVEFHPGKPITTNPLALLAAVELVDYLGAKEIIIGEGPGHMRDTEFLLNATGIGRMCKKHALRFVDLNLDDLEKVDIKDGFSGLKHLYLPRTIVDADAVVSVPKMKTHHWVCMTASMKNLFGTIPGRKYGWPKNLLHIRGIPHCILDIVQVVKPKIGFVDGITAMEGDGPINGTAKETGIIVLGTDVAAVDSTCARIIEAPMENLDYIRMAGQVVGNIDPAQIDIVGASVDSVKQQFVLPITFQPKQMVALSGHDVS